MKILKGIILMMIGLAGVLLGLVLVGAVATAFVGMVVEAFRGFEGSIFNWLVGTVILVGVLGGIVYFIASSPDLFKKGLDMIKEWFKNGKESR